MKRLILATALAISACKGPHVPGDYQGNTQITVVNATDLSLCKLGLWTGEPSEENWLGTGSRMQPVPPGQTRAYSIKPGTYYVGGIFCEGDSPTAAVGSNGKPVAIDGTATIVLGPKPTPRRFHEKHIVFAAVVSLGDSNANGEAPEAAPEACGAAGARVDSPNDCCEHRGHQNPGANGQTAGEPWFCD